MNALQRLCPQSVLLSHGNLITVDKTTKVIEKYLSSVSSESSIPNHLIDLSNIKRDGSKKVQFESISYSSDETKLGYHPYTNGPLNVSVSLVAKSNCSVGSVAVIIFDRYGTKLVNADTLSYGDPIPLNAGKNNLKLRIEQLHLNPGLYTIGLWVADPPVEVYDHIPSAALFEVVETESENIRVQDDGLVPARFQIIRDSKKAS
jgi:lipopolysaccharide transport system ATP-binding protein